MFYFVTTMIKPVSYKLLFLYYFVTTMIKPVSYKFVIFVLLCNYYD